MPHRGQVVQLEEHTKHLIDAGAAGATGLTFMGVLPSVVTALTGIWVCIRIWETVTVQKIVTYIKEKSK